MLSSQSPGIEYGKQCEGHEEEEGRDPEGRDLPEGPDHLLPAHAIRHTHEERGHGDRQALEVVLQGGQVFATDALAGIIQEVLHRLHEEHGKDVPKIVRRGSRRRFEGRGTR